jgi:two-component system response regulator YesN
MIKILIVDDEPIVREGLKTIINWETFGYKIIGEGVDGIDGLDKILSLKPDLVLMDIKMPGMYGIELIKEIKDRGYKGKIILLTGYSDFEYAQSAIKLGVSAYLLKPIDEDELINQLNKLYHEIQKETEIKKHVKDKILKSILDGNESIENYNNIFSMNELNFDFEQYQVAIVETKYADKEDRRKVYEYINNYFSNRGNVDVLHIEDNSTIMFKGKEFNKTGYSLLINLYNQLSQKFKVNIFIGLGQAVSNIGDISISHKQAKSIMKRRFFYEEMNVLTYEKLKSYKKTNLEIEIYSEKLYTAVEVGDLEKLHEIFSNIEVLLKQSECSSEKVKGFSLNLFSKINEKVKVSEPNSKEVLLLNEDIISNIYDKTSLRELIMFLEEECVNISKIRSNISSENIIERILNYIEKNYYKNLKLETLAEIFNYNSAYLGKMFKSYTNNHFNDYINIVRIEKSKELLMDGNLKVYAISEKVGYKNIDYFYIKFKKYVGLSPKEYRNIILNTGEDVKKLEG